MKLMESNMYAFQFQGQATTVKAVLQCKKVRLTRSAVTELAKIIGVPVERGPREPINSHVYVDALCAYDPLAIVPCAPKNGPAVAEELYRVTFATKNREGDLKIVITTARMMEDCLIIIDVSHVYPFKRPTFRQMSAKTCGVPLVDNLMTKTLRFQHASPNSSIVPHMSPAPKETVQIEQGANQ